MSSLVSANGPSITARLLPAYLTRVPFELDWSPFPERNTPDFSRLYLLSNKNTKIDRGLANEPFEILFEALHESIAISRRSGDCRYLTHPRRTRPFRYDRNRIGPFR